MLEALKFVQGAVSKKDFVPALTHYLIHKGQIKSYNGEIALCSEIDLDISVAPKATPFYRAIQACDDVVAIHETANKRLSISSGNFRSLIDCLPIESYPDLYPEGTRVEIDFDLIEALKRLMPFVSDDASRPWAQGILLHKQSAYATNNIVLIEHWLEAESPITVNVPKAAIKELIRVGENPAYLQVTDKSISFVYSEPKRWIRTQLSSLQWPDVNKLLPMPDSFDLQPIPENFFDELERLKPFTADGLQTVHFTGSGVSTTLGEDEGTRIEIYGAPTTGAYNLTQLLLLRDVARVVDWSPYPKPAVFFGKGVRGVVIGQRSAV